MAAVDKVTGTIQDVMDESGASYSADDKWDVTIEGPCTTKLEVTVPCIYFRTRLLPPASSPPAYFRGGSFGASTPMTGRIDG